jgi:hypothetical protein
MKQKRSMDDAISAAKRLRQEVFTASDSDTLPSDVRLKVVETGLHAETKAKNPAAPVTHIRDESTSVTAQLAVPQQLGRSNWVRHTIGLRSTTSLQLRDAAEAQKKKARYGLLRPDEPSNEQEIADLGIRLAIRELG